MKNPWYRFVDLSRKKPLPGVLGPVQNAHTVINWHPTMALPTIERRKLQPRIEVGCVTRVMRKIAAEARQEAADLQELRTMHGSAIQAASGTSQAIQQPEPRPKLGKALWGVMVAGLFTLFLL